MVWDTLDGSSRFAENRQIAIIVALTPEKTQADGTQRLPTTTCPQESSTFMRFDPQIRVKPFRRTGGSRPWALVCAGALVLALVRPGQAAPPRIEVENLRIGFGSSNSFKVGTWTPAWIQLRAGEQNFDGFMEVMVADDDGTPTAFRLPVQVPARSSQQFTAYVRPGSHDPDLNIRLLDPSGRRVGGASQEAVMPQPPVALMPQEMLILTMGRPQGVEALTELPGFRQGGQPGPYGARRVGGELVLARIDTQMGRLPGRWYGFDAARAIVLDTADREVLSALDGGRGLAMVEWVRRGGHLVVSVGSNWQAVRDSVLAPILPGLPNGQETAPSLEALDTFAGSNKPITPPGSAKVLVTKLDEIDQRGGSVLSVMSNLPLIVRGPYGFGRVTLIAMDVDQKLFSDWPDRGLFWGRTIDLRLSDPTRARAAPRSAVVTGSTSQRSPTWPPSFACRSSSFRA